MHNSARSASLVILLFGALSISFSQLSIRTGNISMTVTTGIAGGQPLPVTNSTISLRYALQNRITKITVRTNCPGQSFNLAVVATSVPQGTAAPQVNLVNGMLDTDLIVSIPRRPPNTNQTAALLYTASSTFAQGNSAELGNDVHTVTYTLIDQ